MFYCSRHSIELYLKLIIKQLLHIYKIKIGEDEIYGNIKKENSNLHGIKQLKNNLKSLFIVDPRCKKEFSANLKCFDSLIKDYYFDDRSTAFRYTYSNKIKQNINLSDKKLVHIGILHKKYKKLIKKLEYYYNFFYNIVTEYQTGTFTPKISRAQIEEISKMLPDYSEWDDKLSKAKSKICKKYKLSSNQFSDVLDKIREHRLFSLNIGLENKFKNIRNKTMQNLVEFIKKYEEIISKERVISGIRIKELEKQFQTKGNKFIEDAKEEELAIVLSFVEIGEMSYYCEALERIYKRWSEYLNKSRYILNKICDKKYLLSRGFEICGQKTYIERFEKYYKAATKKNT